MSKNKIIRNFIYLDGEKLNSIYSQVFGGVSGAILESWQNSLDSLTEDHKSFKSERMEEKIGEVSIQTQNRILYDELYNQLEAELLNQIYNCDDVNESDFIDQSNNKFLIKISGNAEIRDYSRLNEFFCNFNKIGEIIAYSQIEGAHNTMNKNIIVNKAKDLNLYQDPKLLENLRFMTDMFHKEGLDVVIKNKNNISFRAVLNKQFLRLQTEALRHLYTHFPSNKLTLLGQVTYIPSTKVELENNTDEGSMADRYADMFNHMQELENIFFTPSNMEVIISPIAIYSEQEIVIEETK